MKPLLSLLAAMSIAGFATAQESTTYQINPEHTGESIWAAPPKLPLTKKWDISLPDAISFPIIADGRIFVVSRSINGNYGVTLFAIDPVDGHRLWRRSIPGTYFWAGIGYGGGRVYVVNFNGRLSAFEPASGQIIWTRQLKGQYAFSSDPVFSNGMVYVGGAGSGGTLYGVDAATGQTLWTGSVENGDHSLPTVSDTAVYVAYAGNQAYKFDAQTGSLLWHHNPPVEGGGGKTTLLTKYGLYTRDFDGDLLLDLRYGETQSTYQSTTIPAASGKLRFDMYNGVVSAVDQTTGDTKWTFSGDGTTLVSAPIVVNSYVIVGGQNGTVYFLKKFTGAVAWSTNVGTAIEAPDEHNVSTPLTGFAAGEGLILIAAGKHLIAYSN